MLRKRFWNMHWRTVLIAEFIERYLQKSEIWKQKQKPKNKNKNNRDKISYH